MNTRHAQIILTTLREGSFTAAARALYITQPTLSQTVRQIEMQLGEPIFVRGRQPLTLTPAGELYVQTARRMIHLETQLTEALSIMRGNAQGVVRIGVMLHRSCELLPQVIHDFYRTYPDVRIECTEGTPQELAQRVEQGTLDIALFSDAARYAKLDYRQIAADEIVLLISRESAFGKRFPSGSTISLTQAREERFVHPRDGGPSRPYFDKLFETAGFSPQIAVTCENIETAKRLAVSGSMAMLCPFISLLCDSASMRRLAHYHLGPDAFMPAMCMVHQKDQPLSPYCELLYTLIANRYRAMTAYRE
ncbi:MAG: LysR family transcriptional regulator [Clostridia bacterium]|nr:LysR family transcriptional regulator [Clostridia bacterium]